jgi:hypothetical protein
MQLVACLCRNLITSHIYLSHADSPCTSAGVTYMTRVTCSWACCVWQFECSLALRHRQLLSLFGSCHPLHLLARLNVAAMESSCIHDMHKHTFWSLCGQCTAVNGTAVQRRHGVNTSVVWLFQAFYRDSTSTDKQGLHTK